MKEGIVFTGTPSIKELVNSPGFPSKDRLRRGAVAVIECVQEIPCNPCELACPFGAIKVGTPITNLPVLFEDKCKGCGVCIPRCPGLAIFLVDTNFSEKEVLVGFPYEYFPLPKAGSRVDAVDREGNLVAKAKVIKVKNPKEYDHTPVLFIAVPGKFAQEVRGIAKEKRR